MQPEKMGNERPVGVSNAGAMAGPRRAASLAGISPPRPLWPAMPRASARGRGQVDDGALVPVPLRIWASLRSIWGLPSPSLPFLWRGRKVMVERRRWRERRPPEFGLGGWGSRQRREERWWLGVAGEESGG